MGVRQSRTNGHEKGEYKSSRNIHYICCRPGENRRAALFLPDDLLCDTRHLTELLYAGCSYLSKFLVAWVPRVWAMDSVTPV